jgi:hypothetical protein
MCQQACPCPCQLERALGRSSIPDRVTMGERKKNRAVLFKDYLDYQREGTEL